LRILSWNVNGLRACARKGFSRWLRRSGGDVIGLQEVRALPDDLGRALCAPRGFSVHFAPAERLGYSGVAVYSKQAPDRVEVGIGLPEFDREGRALIAHYGRLAVVNVYVPKGSGRDRDNSRVPYKLAFSRALFERVEALRRAGQRVLVMGDLNTAHQEIDLARPRQNRGTSGFLPEERAELDRWIAAGWVDTFRRFEPGPGHYSWWSNRPGARVANIGWRIDYVLASPSAMRFVRHAFVCPTVRGSDHCPVGVDLDPAVCALPARAASGRRPGATSGSARSRDLRGVDQTATSPPDAE
jgi:exodeoxyribonuclease-3